MPFDRTEQLDDVGLLPGEIIIDNFAGGGGASEGIEQALGLPITVAINHDREAVAVHRVNHPATRHLCQDVWAADPRDVVKHPRTGAPRPVGLAWFSPDCKHFSKAKGSKPVSKRVRDLAWVVERYAALAADLDPAIASSAPRIIMLENVEEFRDWGDLMPKLDASGQPMTGRDGQPLLIPDPAKAGETFKAWWAAITAHGYVGEWRELRARDYNTPTIRKRLYVIFRRDGRPIRWPAPSNGPRLAAPYRTAAECIDWSLPCPSIFLTREEGRALGVNRPLVENTMARLARGTFRFVIENPRPFMVPLTHTGDTRFYPIEEPARTITTAKRGEWSLVSPQLARATAVAAFLAQHNGGMVGHPATSPLSTITTRGTNQAVVAAFLSNQYTSNTCGGAGELREAGPTITAGGWHQAMVYAFLSKYYGTRAIGHAPDEPAHSLTTKARLGLVWVVVDGQPMVIVDIGMRMLTPRELFRMQGFGDHYVIDRDDRGRAISKTTAIRLCGNSVCPPVAEALVRANFAGGAANDNAQPWRRKVAA